MKKNELAPESVRRGPDKLEKCVRFGCGATVGAVIGFYIALKVMSITFGAFVAWTLGGAVVFGYLAVKHGDNFWCQLRDWLP